MEEKMPEKKELSLEERAKRGKRLVFYGMFSLVVVTFVSVFVTLWVITAPLGPEFSGLALKTALIVTAIALVASVIVWFIYTKLILKQ
jgi:uncharacterized membrane protein YdbT with pleckstrin-like domain